jgi:hypothetical protein
MPNETTSASATALPFAMTALFKAREANDPIDALARAHEVINVLISASN